MKRALSVVCISLAAIVSSPAQWLGKPTSLPAYHETGYGKGDTVPPILIANQLNLPESSIKPVQVHAYELAAKIPQVIYQQPCYCRCDQGFGHKSLRSCFEDKHGGECATCMKELYYSYQMTQQKKTPEQIRMGIVAGEWQQVDLATAASIGQTTPKTPTHKTTKAKAPTT